MIIRRCAQDHDVVIHKNNKPGMTKVIQMADETMSTITYPDSKNYFVWVDGKIEKRTNSFKTAELFYLDECEKKHGLTLGRIDIVKHKLINSKVIMR
tara:strand:- start:403 stop:693 length:291 start_codon:yes stop_codon:yes gene_type:complete